MSYSLSGKNSNDFSITSDGKIITENPLDYASKDSYKLTLTVDGKNDSVDIPLNINVAQNQEPDFVAACENSCSLAETSLKGTVISNSIRTDTDSDELNYALDNNYNDKFTIDPNTGEVKLNGVLDYEKHYCILRRTS